MVSWPISRQPAGSPFDSSFKNKGIVAREHRHGSVDRDPPAIICDDTTRLRSNVKSYAPLSKNVGPLLKSKSNRHDAGTRFRRSAQYDVVMGVGSNKLPRRLEELKELGNSFDARSFSAATPIIRYCRKADRSPSRHGRSKDELAKAPPPSVRSASRSLFHSWAR